MKELLDSFIPLFQAVVLLVLPFVSKSFIKLIFKKSWDVFTSISYGVYGDIIKNPEIILSGPLKHKNEYELVGILTSINILLKNIKYAKWVNKSLAFKTICLAITEGKEYSLGIKEKIERIAETIFLIIISFITFFIFLVIVTWVMTKYYKPPPDNGISNWLYERALFILSNAPLVSLFILISIFDFRYRVVYF